MDSFTFQIVLFFVLFCFGAVLGAVLNAFVDRFGWFPRCRSPWRTWPTEISLRKRRFDYLPIAGWVFLRRFGNVLEKVPQSKRPHGLESRHFWIRPFFVELFAAVGTPLLYHWEVNLQMLLPDGVRPEAPETLFVRFCVHLLLFWLLLAASLIDLDDMIIPDVLTVTGTVLGVTLALFAPLTALPATETQYGMVKVRPLLIGDPYFVLVPTTAPDVVPLNLFSPNPTKSITPIYTWSAMTVLWAFWCFAMMNRVWYAKLPVKKAAAIFFRKLWRTPSTKWYVLAAVIVPLLIFVFAEWRLDFTVLLSAENHQSLLSALVGMATGMTLIWAVRLIGRFVLGREAMGFGDVTLMGMIGAFVGWQSCILIFFLAPFAGLVLGILNAVSGRGREFPYGPFLCLAAAVLIVFWSPIWSCVSPMFEIGWLVAAVMAACFVMLGVLLWLWCRIRDRLFV